MEQNEVRAKRESSPVYEIAESLQCLKNWSYLGVFFYLPHSNFQSCIIALDSYFITTSWKALLFLLSIIMWRAEHRCGNDRRHHTTAHENCSRHLLSMFINKLSVCFQLIRLLGKQVLYGWYGWRQFKKKKCMQKKNTECLKIILKWLIYQCCKMRLFVVVFIQCAF